MPTIQENQARRPEWFINDGDLPADVRAFLTWQSAQPNPHGPGTIGEAWEAAGTGPLYRAHVDRATAELQRHAADCEVARVSGLPLPVAPWAEAAPATPAAPRTTGAKASKGGAAFGGSATE